MFWTDINTNTGTCIIHQHEDSPLWISALLLHIGESKSNAILFRTGIITNTGICIIHQNEACLQTIVSSAPMKVGLRGKHYSCDEKMKSVLNKWLKEPSTEFYRTVIHALILRWNIAIKRNGYYVEK